MIKKGKIDKNCQKMTKNKQKIEKMQIFKKSSKNT